METLSENENHRDRSDHGPAESGHGSTLEPHANLSPRASYPESGLKLVKLGTPWTLMVSIGFQYLGRPKTMPFAEAPLQRSGLGACGACGTLGTVPLNQDHMASVLSHLWHPGVGVSYVF